MSERIQIAFKLSSDDLAQLDGLVPDQYPSRAAALRAAVHGWLHRQRQAEIDVALERGYADVTEDVEMAQGLAASAKQALRGNRLDW